MVRPTSRMCSAISFGVFWREAPSTSAIMRSRNDSPGLAPMRTTMRSDSTLVPPVTAERSPPRLADDRRGLAGDGRLVDRRDALDHLAVAGDELAGLDHDLVALAQRRGRHRLLAPVDQAARGRLLAHLAQRVGLRLAAPLGDGLGEVGEDDREPEPDRDPAGEPERDLRIAGEGVAQEQDRGEQAADLDHEHHRVPGHVLRSQLAEAVDGGLPDQGRLHQPGLCLSRGHQNSSP